MNIIFLALSLILISCGKPKEDGSSISDPDRTPARTNATRTVQGPAERLESQCFVSTPSGNLEKILMLKGNFYKGTIWKCDNTGACLGNGMYFHYFEPAYSCLTKRGFEEEFTMCIERDRIEERSSTIGPLVQLDVTIDSQKTNLWCRKNILKILFYKPPTEA